MDYILGLYFSGE